MDKQPFVSFYYEQLFKTAVVLDKWKPEAIKCAKLVIKGWEQYEAVAKTVNDKIPWYFIGLLHLMESTCKFDRHLHNGNSLKQRTVDVPKGRPLKGNPPFTWHDSACDALIFEGFAGHTTWTLPEILYRFEKYNGLGYRSKGIYTPYLWSGTNHYTKGKYVADSHYNPNEVSEQIGCAPVLIQLIA